MDMRRALEREPTKQQWQQKVVAAATAIKAAIRSGQPTQPLVDSWEVCGQLREITNGGPDTQPKQWANTFARLWTVAWKASNRGLAKASWCPSRSKWPEWKSDQPMTSGHCEKNPTTALTRQQSCHSWKRHTGWSKARAWLKRMTSVREEHCKQ